MDNNKKEIYAQMMERLIDHFRKRTDLQNIDIMNLAGFCRNCLAKWYVEASKDSEKDIDYEKAREIIYGMPYQVWKSKYQVEASKEKLEIRKNLKDN
ncbi:MAG: hypothetical protein CFH21_00395 [Alphaproteobacteria bacterium MarineAlpha5_Bin11]|nr:hypothetical protein [Pelagibacteraceae bacterium]PPR44302.1 MAG: hypothetical protein CFH21_00395 [Alphaproteobacteria bacterium MarineAlpha5_Bin11]PPR52014.1 MAG: hypothetical protein CFH20_00202 [Alphaproteobacteria bacterium MarineAlpha5_Bin10]|tara:strand:+ start:608 stop:898 length:291 start_codon:yes stop_codon:yes gene_type:complete